MDHLGNMLFLKLWIYPEALNGVVNKQKRKEIYETIVEHQGLEKVMSF